MEISMPILNPSNEDKQDRLHSIENEIDDIESCLQGLYNSVSAL